MTDAEALAALREQLVRYKELAEKARAAQAYADGAKKAAEECWLAADEARKKYREALRSVDKIVRGDFNWFEPPQEIKY